MPPRLVLPDGSPATAPAAPSSEVVLSEHTLMSLDEFISWGSQKPLLPGSKPEDDMRLGWDPTFESALRWAVTQALRDKAKKAVGLDPFERKATLKAWLEVCFKILMSEPKVRDMHLELNKLSPAARQAVTRMSKPRSGPEQQQNMRPLTQKMLRGRGGQPIGGSKRRKFR